MHIASVAVDVALPHLDRPFDYRIPPDLDVAVGLRVRVPFAGRLVTGYVMDLHDDTSRATADIRAVVSAAVVLPPAQAALVRAVADRYAASFSDVVRFAVPTRHARTETAALTAEPLDVVAPTTREPLPHRGATAFFDRHARGEALAACVEVPTGSDLDTTVLQAATTALAHGPVIVVAPDARSVDRLARAAAAEGLEPIVMRMAAGPAARQRAFTAAATARRALVIGTRTSVFAPLQLRGLTIVVDDGNDALVESQTPGWSAREVALARCAVQTWSALFIGRHRSVELQAHVEAGTVKPLLLATGQWRAASVRVETVAERFENADPLLQRLRIPSSVFRAIRSGLDHGSVLVSVARRGYVNAMACAGCREHARCTACDGPLALRHGESIARCGWCGTSAGGWTCTWCGDKRLRNITIGIERTSEELGRAFPGVPLRWIDAEHPLEQLPDEPTLLLATPGMEPAGRCALAVILDVDQVLARHDLAAGAEAVRRWSAVAAATRPDGRVLIVGPPTAPAVQALVRSDPAGFAERELAARRAVGLPPARHVAVVVAAPKVAAEMATEIAAAANAHTLGPVPVGEQSRLLVLTEDLAALVAAVRAAVARRSAAKTLGGVHVRIDPLELPA